MVFFNVRHVLAGVNVEDLTQRTYKFFGPGTVYDLPLNDPYRKKDGTVPVLLLRNCRYRDVHNVSIINLTGLNGCESLCYCLITPCIMFFLLADGEFPLHENIPYSQTSLFSVDVQSFGYFTVRMSYKYSAAVNHHNSTEHFWVQ